MVSDADALEAAIHADPDAVLPWAVYADYLAERGDPRGEFMHVQLVLEDARLTTEERGRLAAREAALLAEHGAGWLGAIAPAVLHPRPAVDGPITARFRRGWLSELAVPRVTAEFARDMNASPELRFLRRFETLGSDVENDYGEMHDTLAEFPYWSGVREFHFGNPVNDLFLHAELCASSDDCFTDYLERMPNLESLTLLAYGNQINFVLDFPMPCLRHLQLGYADDYSLESLASNKTVFQLTRLICWASDSFSPIGLGDIRAVCQAGWSLDFLRLRFSDFGDAGARVLADSDLWGTLHVLDLACGRITDAGALELASARGEDGEPVLSHLRALDLSRNALTEIGVAAILAVMPRANLADQHDDLPTNDPDLPPNCPLER